MPWQPPLKSIEMHDFHYYSDLQFPANDIINTLWGQSDYYNQKQNKVLSFKHGVNASLPQDRFRERDLHSLFHLSAK